MVLQIYVASSLLNIENVKKLIDILNQYPDKFKITYNWTIHGCISDTNLLSKIAKSELDGIQQSDIVILYLPGRNGTCFEFGYAYALQKKIIIFDDNNHFQHFKQTSFFNFDFERFTSLPSIIDYLLIQTD